MDNLEPRTESEAALLDFKRGVGEFTARMPGVAGKYNAFAEECFKEGSLGQKEKQLLALGISVCLQDEYCIIYHTKGCVDQGASEEEILDALGVAAAFGGGAAISQAVTLVFRCMSDFKKH